MLKITTFTVGSLLVIRRVASMPFKSGRPMSMRTTAGGAAHEIDGAVAVAGLTDHLELGIGIDDAPEPVAQHGMVIREKNAELTHRYLRL
jgi:hypothetical protein